MKKRLIFECSDYVLWEVEEIIWLNTDGSYTPSYPNNIHILESRMNEGKNFIFLKYHWTQTKTDKRVVENMTYTEAKHRIIRKLPNDFLQDDGNRIALNIMEDLFDRFDEDNIQSIEYKMCANTDMAIYILEFIKQGYKRKYQDAGVQKYIEALEMGIDALKKKEELKPVPFKRTAHDFCNGVCEHSHYPCKHLKIYNNEYQYTDYKCPSCNKIISDGTPNNCCHCGQTLDWSKE